MPADEVQHQTEEPGTPPAADTTDAEGNTSAESGTSGLYTVPGEQRFGELRLYNTVTVEALRKVSSMDFSGDVIISSYPKTGSHWSKEITWLVRNDADVEGAKAATISERAKWLEGRYPAQDLDNVDRLLSDPDPKVIATHLGPSFFTENLERDSVKFVVVIRNPKDTLVSYYNFYRGCSATGHYQGSWEEYFELYKAKMLPYCDYFDFYLEWLPYLERNNVMLLQYEDMLYDLTGCVKRLAKFLDRDISDEQVRAIAENTVFDKMKANPMTNFEKHERFKSDISAFMRKGQVGDWVNYFSDEQSRMIDERYQETLANAGVKLRFE